MSEEKEKVSPLELLVMKEIVRLWVQFENETLEARKVKSGWVAKASFSDFMCWYLYKSNKK